MNKLREEFEKISLKKQRMIHSELKRSILFAWNEAIIKKGECCGHGDYRNVAYGNIEYVRFLEKKLEDKRIKEALEIIYTYAGIGGSDYKQWILDQVVRIVTKDQYENWVKKYNNDPDNRNYQWDEGMKP